MVDWWQTKTPGHDVFQRIRRPSLAPVFTLVHPLGTMEDHIVSAHPHPPNYEDDRNTVDIARCLLSSCPRFQVEEEILLTAAPKSTGDPGSKAIASSQCAVASVHRKWYHKFALKTWLFLMTPIPTNLHGAVENMRATHNIVVALLVYFSGYD